VWGSPSVLVTLTGGLCLLALLVVVELRTVNRGGQPLIDLRLFANGPFLSSNIANAMISFSFFGSMILLPIYMQNLRGISAFQLGLFTLSLAFVAVLAAIIGGRMVDRFGPRVVLLPGLILMGLSTWQLAEISLTTSYPWLLLIFAVRGLGLGCLIQPLTVSALSKVSRGLYTQASSLNTVMRFTFTSLGIAVLATLVQSRATTHISTLILQSRPVSQAALRYFASRDWILLCKMPSGSRSWLSSWPLSLSASFEFPGPLHRKEKKLRSLNKQFNTSHK
jgi:MFS family permease